MARKPPETTYRPAELSIEQIQRAIPRLERRIADLKNLNTSGMHDRGGPAIQAIKVSIEQTLEEVFGAYTTEYKRYSPAAILSGGPIIVGRGSSIDHRPYYERSRLASIALLEQAVQSLIERRDDLVGVQTVVVEDEGQDEVEVSNRIFVVHGRDGEHRETVARFLGQLGLEAVILHEQPNKGRALITKFQEVAADIGFAVVLMTPDDLGGIRDGEQHLRARQNVIFELGFFIGALGADRVAALVSPQVERPSDFDGVVYISLEGEWRLPLCRELRAAGYDVDLNKVL
ncbi:nucleotide-binding protein [Bradyrhizobium sp. CB2312]|uniref:nucleotide-binding protein n=1 Tax=Bradyrhizobium sp. CB2312 TaxID=3039155 RepID=UPI0024B0913C|nr:nucleotide-binding protein [Bradyrhizobium sp. CB2312]WFU73829.1 nucleotide-binding protein [Bradyrhizobium sp. CB2312]